MTTSKTRDTAHIVDALNALSTVVSGKADADHAHDLATSTQDGFMSSTQAVRVNNMRENAGAGLTKDTSQRFAHGDTSSVADVDNSGANVIQDLTFDTYGHVQSHTSVEITPAAIGAAVSGHTHDLASSTQSGFMSSDQAVRVNNMRQNAGAGLTKDSSQRFAHGSTSTVTDADNSGANVIQDLTFDAYGHVQSHTSVEVTPAMIGAATSGHTHNLSDINVDAGLDMSSQSITNATTVSSNNLVLATGGALVSAANWTQSGTTALSGVVTVNAETTINDASLTVESDDLATTNPTININALDQGTSNIDRGFSLAFDQSDSRKFEVYFPDIDSNGGKSKVIHQDEDGGLFFQPKGSVDGLRLVHEGSLQHGFSGSTNGSSLLGSATTGTGFQIRHDGWTAISSGHDRILDLNVRVDLDGNSYPSRDAVTMRHNGLFAGALRYDSSQNIYLATSSDRRLKDEITDLSGAMDEIMALLPKTYRFKRGGDTRPGLVAQDVESLTAFQGAVTTHDEDDMKSVRSLDYTYFIPHLIQALKEANGRINRLEAKVAEMGA